MSVTVKTSLGKTEAS